MLQQTVWVAHSPYPDQSWRGLEKCATAPFRGALAALFESEEACWRHIDACGARDYMDQIVVEMNYRPDDRDDARTDVTVYLRTP